MLDHALSVLQTVGGRKTLPLSKTTHPFWIPASAEFVLLRTASRLGISCSIALPRAYRPHRSTF